MNFYELDQPLDLRLKALNLSRNFHKELSPPLPPLPPLATTSRSLSFHQTAPAVTTTSVPNCNSNPLVQQHHQNFNPHPNGLGFLTSNGLMVGPYCLNSNCSSFNQSQITNTHLVHNYTLNETFTSGLSNSYNNPGSQILNPPPHIGHLNHHQAHSVPLQRQPSLSTSQHQIRSSSAIPQQHQQQPPPAPVTQQTATSAPPPPPPPPTSISTLTTATLTTTSTTATAPTTAAKSATAPSHHQATTITRQHSLVSRYHCKPCGIVFSQPETLRAHQEGYCTKRDRSQSIQMRSQSAVSPTAIQRTVSHFNNNTNK